MVKGNEAKNLAVKDLIAGLGAHYQGMADKKIYLPCTFLGKTSRDHGGYLIVHIYLPSAIEAMKALIYLGKNTSPLSERSTSVPSNLFTVLPDLKPKDSNTEKGASTDRQLTFIMPVCLMI